MKPPPFPFVTHSVSQARHSMHFPLAASSRLMARMGTPFSSLRIFGTHSVMHGFASQVRQTTYLWPDDPMPTYDAVPRARNRWLAVAAGSVAASAVMYGAAWGERAAFFGPADSLEQLDRRRSATLGFTVASGALLGIGLGTGGVALVTGSG